MAIKLHLDPAVIAAWPEWQFWRMLMVMNAQNKAKAQKMKDNPGAIPLPED